MATAITLKLVKGSRTLDLNSGRYTVGRDFKPPTVNVSPLIATGTSANKYGEGQRIDRRFNQRQWSFEVRIVATSEAEGRFAVRDLAAMLEQAGDESDPLYVHYKPNSDTPVKLSSRIFPNIVSHTKFQLTIFFFSRPTLFMVEWGNVWYNG